MAYILIIDDDPDMCQALKIVLAAENYEVNTETDLEKALIKIQERCPDLILLDVMFPGNDAGGFAFAQSLKKDVAYRDLPILMLTAVNQQFSFNFSQKDIDDKWMPVADFIEKPANFDVLKKKVAVLLNKK